MSSTERYRLAAGELANCGAYDPADVVFVSAEGNRTGRKDPPWDEIDKAIAVGVTFITDDAPNRERPYNVGERQVADYLTERGYTLRGDTWKPIKNIQEEEL